MKNIWLRIKRCLLTDGALDSQLRAFERIEALENYVKDLKWAIERLGFDPEKHGVPPPWPPTIAERFAAENEPQHGAGGVHPADCRV